MITVLLLALLCPANNGAYTAPNRALDPMRQPATAYRREETFAQRCVCYPQDSIVHGAKTQPTAMHEIKTKRAYDPPSTSDGSRFLVDRLWPRGLSKRRLRIEAWLKDVAPSTEMRKKFHHAPEKWPEFRRLYTAQLKSSPEKWQPLLAAAEQGPITLLFSARDTDRNNAVVLKAFLDKHSAEEAKPKLNARRTRKRSAPVLR